MIRNTSTTSDETITARAMVIATGAFQQPVVPAVARLLDNQVTQQAADSDTEPALSATSA